MRVNLPAIRKFRDDLVDRTNINDSGGVISGVLITHPDADSKGDQRWIVTTDTGLIYSFGDGTDHIAYDDTKWSHRGAVKWVLPLTRRPRSRTMLAQTRVKLCASLLDVPFGGAALVEAQYVQGELDRYLVRLVDDDTVAIDRQGRPRAWYVADQINRDQLNADCELRCLEQVDKRLRQLRDRLTTYRRLSRQ